jgi:hypothetical protein
MLISIGLELDNEGRALAWALDLPGCFAYGADGSEAVAGLAHELLIYEDWINRHAGPGGLVLGDLDLRVVDTWQVYTIDDHYDRQEGAYAVNAWFLHDWKPLSGRDIAHGLDLLRWSREDFLRLIGEIGEELMDRSHPGERWTIRGIVKHVANAEWWYLDRLGLAEGGCEQVPKDVFDRLGLARECLNQTLLGLEGREIVVGKEGEFWSARKLLRRALWHEIDHYRHIQNLVEKDRTD